MTILVDGAGNDKIEVSVNNGTITVKEDLNLQETSNVVIPYSSAKEVDDLKDEFTQIARLFEGYESTSYASVNNEDNIAIPFGDDSNNVYVIEYGTYEFLHHFLNKIENPLRF